MMHGLLNYKTILTKVSSMTDVSSIAIDLRTAIGALVAIIMSMFAGAEYLSFVKRGEANDQTIRNEIKEMRQILLTDHNVFRGELKDIRKMEDERHAREAEMRTEMAIRLSNSETTAQFIQKDMDLLVRSVDWLLERQNANHEHPYP